jgi:hypothetical protein
MIGPLLKHEIENTFRVVPGKSTSEELVFMCPECGDRSGHRSVNLKTGKTFCWRCNKGKNNKGYFLAWAKALGYQFNNDGGQSLPVEQVLYGADDQDGAVPLIQEVKLPKGFMEIKHRPKSVYTKLIGDMAKRKNLTLPDFFEAGVGYTMDTPLWEPYAIFPVREFDICVYYQGRTYIDVPGETTKKFPSRSEVKYGAAYWVYNIDEVRASQPEIVIIVESILNVLSLRWKLRELGWDKTVVPVCVFKHHISQVQVIKLARCVGVKEFCFLFDHDAIEQTWRNISGLANRRKVSVAEMPMLDGNEKMDANDNVDAAIGAIEKRKLFTPANAQERVFDNGEAFDLRSRKIRS